MTLFLRYGSEPAETLTVKRVIFFEEAPEAHQIVILLGAPESAPEDEEDGA